MKLTERQREALIERYDKIFRDRNEEFRNSFKENISFTLIDLEYMKLRQELHELYVKCRQIYPDIPVMNIDEPYDDECMRRSLYEKMVKDNHSSLPSHYPVEYNDVRNTVDILSIDSTSLNDLCTRLENELNQKYEKK